MKRITLISAKMLMLLFIVASGSVTAQDMTFRDYLVKKEAERKASITEYVKNNPDVKLQDKDYLGNMRYLHHIDANSRPVYYSSRSNVGLATSIKTNKLWNGGGLSLDLQGQNMEVSASQARLGVFEPGPVRTSHQEFGGRATTRDLPVFSTSDGNTEHATHVTGTMIASGVDATAKGMANAAKIDCYEVQTDEYVEIFDAGTGGMLVSNHSYGPNYDNTKVTLGVYSDDCNTHDTISYINKSHLQFIAAGNDRDDGNSITYDILVGGCIAKNVATVGAVEILGSGGYTGPGSVTMSDFSSYGPTDDGRIKPDFCAPGVQIYSSISTNDASYQSEDGTSMATPGAAASMFLLQQHHKNKKTTFMKSATLKGLGIHTADECGANPGPDYAYGWGLLNMEKAIDVIDNKNSVHLMAEAILNNGATYQQPITSPGGVVKVTICWTDLPGTPLVSAPVDDRTPMLVNDLDLRIIDANTNMPISTLPWKLDPANPSSAATRGDNNVDNVEQIYVSSLPAGNYIIQVTHKATLSDGKQEFSLIATGVAQTTSLDKFYVKNANIKAYPNPFSDNITVEAKNWKTITVSNTVGQTVVQYNANNKQKILQINTREWANGLYVISIVNEDDSIESVSLVK